MRKLLLFTCIGLLFSAASADHDIISWIRKCGGTVDLELGVVNDEGMRGTKAVRNMQKGQIAVHLPAHLAVELGPTGVPSEDNAIYLLRTQRDDPAWNLSMTPYWESLPPVGGSLTKQTFPHDSLDMLQDKVLAASIIVQAAYTRNIFDGGKPASIEDFQAELPGVSYEQYAHITSVIASYAYLFPDEAGTPRRMLLPLLDLMNHGDPERVNLDIMQAENGDFFAYTLRDIKQGEELVHAYNAAIKRNDQALFHYGFVQEQSPPKLAAQDLPGGNLYDPSKYSEEDHSFGGALVSKEELERLEAILRSFPTTAEQDAQLLAGKGSSSWGSWWNAGKEQVKGPVERMFVRYRMFRKLALANAIQSLRDALLVSGEL